MILSPQAGTHIIGQLLGELGKFSKKVRGWMHLSKMGSGHSETLSARSNQAMYRYHTTMSLYEAHWWDRKVTRDGGPNFGEPQFAAAKEYANMVSIGNLSQLRNFLEQSLSATDRREPYVGRFYENFLNSTGRAEFAAKFKELFKVSRFSSFSSLTNIKTESLTKFMVGFTRKRKLIVPEWADDDKLWVKQPKLA